MANIQNDNFLLKGKKTLDARRLRLDGTPWTSISEVLMAFIQEDRVESQVYFIVDREYWFLGGTNNIHLVEKKTGTEYVDSSTIHFEPTTASVKDNSITPAKLQPINNNTILGNNVGSTTNPKALTVSEVKTMLALENVNNTNDINKPVSILQAASIATKQKKIEVIYIGADTTLSAIHEGAILIITAFITLTIPTGLAGNFVSCVIDVKVGQCTIASGVGVTLTGYYSLILETGDRTSIYKEDAANNNFRVR